MKKAFAVVALCFALFGAMVLSPKPSSVAGAGLPKTSTERSNALRALCVANQIRAFSAINYNFNAGGVACGFHGLRSFPTMLFSAVNRCGNKTNYLRLNGDRVACMNPGGNRPSPGAFNEIWVVERYGAFC
jgi:hypothetical protein